ncbi:MAG: hypothetical protein L3J01_04765 [Thiomicrorhabdus sp.]|nr:hypothetical protein [Thiomicrorhabdus sp.]
MARAPRAANLAAWRVQWHDSSNKSIKTALKKSGAARFGLEERHLFRRYIL